MDNASSKNVNLNLAKMKEYSFFLLSVIGFINTEIRLNCPREVKLFELTKVEFQKKKSCPEMVIKVKIFDINILLLLQMFRFSYGTIWPLHSPGGRLRSKKYGGDQ